MGAQDGHRGTRQGVADPAVRLKAEDQYSQEPVRLQSGWRWAEEFSQDGAQESIQSDGGTPGRG